MNEKIQEFIRGVGALTELWLITYNMFVQQGCDKASALLHTKGLVSTILTVGSDNKTKGEGL